MDLKDAIAGLRANDGNVLNLPVTPDHYIDDEGAKELADALTTNNTLQKLD